jgi:hypothetical protein
VSIFHFTVTQRLGEKAIIQGGLKTIVAFTLSVSVKINKASEDEYQLFPDGHS